MPSRHGTQGFVMDPGCGLGVRFLGGRPCVPGWAALSGSPFCNPPPHVKGFSWKGARGPIGWVGNGAGHMELGWEEPSGMASLENAPNTLSLGTGSEYLQGQHHVHCWPPHNTAQDRTPFTQLQWPQCTFSGLLTTSSPGLWLYGFSAANSCPVLSSIVLSGCSTAAATGRSKAGQGVPPAASHGLQRLDKRV